MWQLHCFTTVHKSSPMASWIVKCPWNAHFRISPKRVGHLGTFRLLLYEYCKFGHTTLFTYCLSLSTILSGIMPFRMQPYSGAFRIMLGWNFIHECFIFNRMISHLQWKRKESLHCHLSCENERSVIWVCLKMFIVLELLLRMGHLALLEDLAAHAVRQERF